MYGVPGLNLRGLGSSKGFCTKTKGVKRTLELRLYMGGFPKIRATFLRLPRIRIIEHSGVYIGVPLCMETTMSASSKRMGYHAKRIK